MDKFLAEFFGTAFLLMIIVGSGIMGEQLSQGNDAITLLANSIATGAGLFVLIQSLGSISGAHFNPIVTLMEKCFRRISWIDSFIYWIAQFSGAIVGVFISHLMFNQTILQIASKNRNAPNLWLSEIVATFGLISVIALVNKKNIQSAPLTIAAYITSAYWFTSSTSFANPAVTIARMLTDTFSGISPSGVPIFISAQFLVGFGAFLIFHRQT